MKYNKEILENKNVKFELEVNKEEWEHCLEDSYEHNKSKYKVQGFRGGKVPRKIIEKNYGDTVFYDDAINHAFYHYFEDVLEKEKDVELVGNPKVDVKKIDENGLTLVVTCVVRPDVVLGEYKGLKIEKPEAVVTDEEVDAEIKAMQEKSSRWVKTEREAKLGDTVIMDFVGSESGVEFEGGKAENFELELGSHRFIEGFEDQIVGMKAGEEKNIDVKFPEDYPAENLKGKPAVFKINLHEVREKEIPELTDEFAKNVSEFDTLNEYKEDIKKHLLERKSQKAEYDYEEALLKAVSENSNVVVPEEMIDEQVDAFIHDFEQRLMQQGMKLEDYLKYLHQTMEDLKAGKRDDAKKVIVTRLTMEEIINKEKITVEPEELDKKLEEIAGKVGKTVEEYKKSLNQNILGNIVNQMVVDKLLKFLKENNK